MLAYRWGWDLDVIQYENCNGTKMLARSFACCRRIMQGHRPDYDLVENNQVAHNMLGVFPEQTHPVPNITQWTEVTNLPGPGSPELQELCCNHSMDEGNGYVCCCCIIFPFMKEATWLTMEAARLLCGKLIPPPASTSFKYII